MSKNDFPKKIPEKPDKPYTYQTCNRFPWQEIINIILFPCLKCLMEGGELHNIFGDAFNKCDLEEIKKANIYHTNIICSILKESLTGDEPLNNLYKTWKSQQIRYINFPKKPIQIQSGNHGDLQISEPIYLYTLEDLACYISKKLKFHTQKKPELSDKFKVFNDNLEEFKIKKETQQIQQHEMEQKTEFQLQKSQKENEELRKEIAEFKVRVEKITKEKQAKECEFNMQINGLKEDLQKKEKKLKDEKKEVDSLEERLSKKRSEVRILEEENERSKSQVRILEEENERLKIEAQINLDF